MITAGRIAALVSAALLASFSSAYAANNATEKPKAGNNLVIHADQGKETINKNIYGHFSEHLGRCVYEGYWVGEDSPIPNTRGIRNDVVAALKQIQIPVLRWPGGCFADEYHWIDGIGPRAARIPIVNTHWGMVTETNHFGTHEFMDLCAQLGCEPYICGNVGSGTVQEMQQWVEYLTADGQGPMVNMRRQNGRNEPWKVKYWGIGNENWGCGGNMRPEYYADLYRRFSTYLRNFGANRLYKIACGANSRDYRWTDVLMREAGNRMNGLSLHYYCGSGRKSRSATEFVEDDWFAQLQRALRMDEYVTSHAAIMDKYDPKKRVALIVDEWGAWHAVEPDTNPGFLYQQNSLRDALVAGVTLNIFNNHCDRVKMANIAQTVNVLQAMILTDKEKMIVTPTYHVFDLYKVHQDATLLPVDLTCADYQFGNGKIPGLSASASRDKSGKIHVSLCNLDPNNPADVVCELQGAKPTSLSGQVLTAKAMTAHNTFGNPKAVRPADFTGARLQGQGERMAATLPPMSVVVLEME